MMILQLLRAQISERRKVAKNAGRRHGACHHHRRGPAVAPPGARSKEVVAEQALELRLLKKCMIADGVTKMRPGKNRQDGRLQTIMQSAQGDAVRPSQAHLEVGQLRLRGRTGAQDEFLLPATARNFRRMANA
jgi:hypothetical protein